MNKLFLALSLLATFLCVTPSMAVAADKEAPADQDQQQALPKEVASDTNKDGKPDRWEKYLNGQPVSIEADGNYDGIVDEKGFFANGKLIKVEKDSDGDGKIDKWVTY